MPNLIRLFDFSLRGVNRRERRKRNLERILPAAFVDASPAETSVWLHCAEGLKTPHSGRFSNFCGHSEPMIVILATRVGTRQSHELDFVQSIENLGSVEMVELEVIVPPSCTPRRYYRGLPEQFSPFTMMKGSGIQSLPNRIGASSGKEIVDPTISISTLLDRKPNCIGFQGYTSHEHCDFFGRKRGCTLRLELETNRSHWH